MKSLHIILAVLVLCMSIGVVSADDDSIGPSDIIGNPLDAFESIQEPVKWLLGFAVALFVIVSVAAILISGTTAQMGALVKNASLRQGGMANVMNVVGIVIAVTMAVMVFWYVIGEFLL